MKRKVIQHGSTLTLTLPVQWTRKNNISKKDEIEVEEVGNGLRVYNAEKESAEKTIEIDVGNLNEEMIKTLIGIAYKSGYDKLTLLNSNQATTSFIQKRVNSSLIGCEILKQTSTGCVIKCLHIDSSKEFNNMVRRMFLILEALGQRTVAMVETQIYDESLLDLESAMNRLCNSCHRLINEEEMDREKSGYLYVILWTIESIADEYRDIVNLLLENRKLVVNRNLLDAMKELAEVGKEYSQLFYKYNAVRMQKLKENLRRLKREMKYTAKGELWTYLYTAAGKYEESLNSIIGFHC